MTCTTTGQRLADRLQLIGGPLAAGEIPRCIGQKISDALDAAEQQLRRKAALEAILAMFDPNGCQSLWQLAKRIEAAIRRLNGVPLRRIQSGHRPATPMEALLMELLELPGARTHEKLFQELRKLASRSE